MTREVHSKSRISRYTPAAIIAAAIIAMLSSCNLLNMNSIVKPATISDCINGFSSTYHSGNDSILYQYFSTNVSIYNQIKPSTYWSGTPFDPTGSPTALASINISTSTNTVTATFSNNTSGPYNATFTMENDGGYWYIRTLTVDLNTTNALTIN